MEHLTAPGLRPYRALWAYLASAWSSLAAAAGQSGAVERAAALLQQANAAAEGTWLRELQWLPSGEDAGQFTDFIGNTDKDAAEAVVQALDGRFRSATALDKKTSAMLSGLSQASAPRYEQALVMLGTLLGAESVKPPGQGRADAVWVWPQMWITLEAKTEQTPQGAISMDCIRQANTQLASLEDDRDEDPPEGSFSLIVSPRTVVAPDAVPIANGNLCLVTPEVVLDLAHDAVRAWTALRGAALGGGQDGRRSAAAQVLWQYRVLPTQINDRLAADAIGGQ